jgi:hypothetical protein
MTETNISTSPPTGYDASKFNAIKHGVLSKETVLGWESQDDYHVLVTAFEEEYQPNGITETYLVTELAQIVWRKRRLRMAESGLIKSNLESCDGLRSNVMKRAVYGHPTIEKGHGNVEDSVRISDKEAALEIKQLKAAINGLNNLLNKDYTYEEYLTHVDDELKENWQDWLSDETAGYSPNAVSFKKFLQKNYITYLQEQQLNPLLIRDAIKHEAICEAVQPTEQFVNLSRYESHLDRKFERTLSMIVKLQELRKCNALANNDQKRA